MTPTGAMEIFLIAFIGLLIGIVVNRAADNLPPHRSLFDSPRCDYCDTPRSALDQIAALNFLLLRGHCGKCRAPIRLRAPIVEIVSAFAFAFLWSRDGATANFVLHTIYTTIFLLVFVIDLEHRLILNVVILPATLLALLLSPLSQYGPVRSIIGGVIGYGIVYLIYVSAQIFSRMRGHKIAVPFGYGDVRLAGFMGIVTAFPSVLPAILLTILLGGAGAILFLGYHFIFYRRLPLGAAIPYGPFFCIAGWVMMVWG